MLSQRPLEDTAQDRELLEKCLELFEIIEWRCHTASVLAYVKPPAGSTRPHPTSSTVIDGILHPPNLNHPGPNTGKGEGGKGLVVNASKSAHHSTPTSTTSSEPRRHPGACVIEGDTGIEYYIGFDRAFAQVSEPGGGVGGAAEEHSNYFASYQQPTYSVGLQ